MTLHLLPNLLDAGASPELNFVQGLDKIVNNLDGFLVEHPKEARKFLKHFDFATLREKPMEILDKRTDNFDELIDPLKKGESWGVLSDAGLPCLADPGSKLVAYARENGIAVKAYPGPCSMILALMLSGLDSQRFAFQGYLPRQIDQTIRKNTITQVFIETPYKNQRSFETLLEVLHDPDLLSIACDLTLPSQEVITLPVREWKKKVGRFDFHKRPAIFLIKTSPGKF